MAIKVFIHIPKCGGSTMRDKMLSFFKKNQVLKIYHNDPEKGYYSSLSYQTKYPDLLTSNVKAICGHIPYQEIQQSLAGKDHTIISLIRDPVDRAISNINYMKTKPNHSGHKFSLTITKDNLFSYLSKRNDISYQANYLGLEYFGSIKAILDNIGIYKLDNYKKALFDIGIISNFEEHVDIKNITTSQPAAASDKYRLLSKNDLAKEDLLTLKDIYYIDYELLSAAS
ncbi:MAG: hypothetical protein ACI8O8_003222 [Oleiphilaceae bacterium]|jgi:hypothetical protein